MNGESWVVKCNVRARQEPFRSIDSLFGNVKNLVNISQTFWSQNVKLDLNVLHMVQKFSDLINMMIVFRRNVNADIQHNKCKLKRIMIVICFRRARNNFSIKFSFGTWKINHSFCARSRIDMYTFKRAKSRWYHKNQNNNIDMLSSFCFRVAYVARWL